MIERYRNSNILAVFGPKSKIARWEEISRKVAENERGVSGCPRVKIGTRELKQRELETGHDVAAFVQLFQEKLPAEWRPFVHRRLTSSDLVDTGFAMAIQEANRQVEALTSDLISEHRRFARLDSLTVARTHGRIALPYPVCDRHDKMIYDLQQVRLAVPEGKVGGPIGNSYSKASIEKMSGVLGIRLLPPGATQCVPRYQYLHVMNQLLMLSTIVASHATNLRLWMIEGVEEYYIDRPRRHVGSSSMPHKNNPIELEQVCGLFRLVHGYHTAMTHSVTLWHERDISHSCVDRVAIEDTFHAICRQLSVMASVLRRCVFRPKRHLVTRAKGYARERDKKLRMAQEIGFADAWSK